MRLLHSSGKLVNQNPIAVKLMQALERILHHIQNQAPGAAQALQRGLTREQIAAQLEGLPFRLPEEVYQLYQWRNGSTAEARVEFLPQYRFLSLEEAIAEWQFVDHLAREIYENLDGNPQQELIDSSECHWLPLFAEDGNYYVISGDTESRETASISHRFYINFELKLQFDSLTEMMEAIAECFDTRAYYFDLYSYLNADYVRAAQVWLRHQPWRSTNVATVLNNQSENLSDEDLWQAYFDLIETQHPQTLSVLAEAIEVVKPEVINLQLQMNNAPTLSEKAAAMDALSLREGRLQQLLCYVSYIKSQEAIQYLRDFVYTGLPITNTSTQMRMAQPTSCVK